MTHQWIEQQLLVYHLTPINAMHSHNPNQPTPPNPHQLHNPAVHQLVNPGQYWYDLDFQIKSLLSGIWMWRVSQMESGLVPIKLTMIIIIIIINVIIMVWHVTQMGVRASANQTVNNHHHHHHHQYHHHHHVTQIGVRASANQPHIDHASIHGECHTIHRR